MQDRLFLVIAAIIISLAVISWSFQHGRLQYQMDYEDIITHIDGLKRLTDLSEGGGGVYLANYLKMPPHAPLHSMMASIGFIIFGVKDWAPYAVNALVLTAPVRTPDQLRDDVALLVEEAKAAQLPAQILAGIGKVAGVALKALGV